MIGHRVGPNGHEGKVLGLSHRLPVDQVLVCLCVKRFSEVLVRASADSSDFYHQVMVSDESVGPVGRLNSFAGTRTHASLLAAPSRPKSSAPREDTGDGFCNAGDAYGCLYPCSREMTEE